MIIGQELKPPDVDIKRMSQVIADVLRSSTPSVEDIVAHQTSLFGKMLRAQLLLLSASLYSSGDGERTIMMAVVIEMIHMATLCHDDVIDKGTMRRLRLTLRAIKGNKASILMGDYILARALHLVSLYGDIKLLQAISQAAGSIFEGELMQQTNRGLLGLSENEYMEVIRRKTGCLFALASQLGAMLGCAPETDAVHLAAFGLLVGTAFQMVDDCLDYTSEIGKFGKRIGLDFFNGIITLPLIKAYKNATAEERRLVTRYFGHGVSKEAALPRIVEIVRRRGGVDYTIVRATALVEQAQGHLEALCANDRIETLSRFAHGILSRFS